MPWSIPGRNDSNSAGVAVGRGAAWMWWHDRTIYDNRKGRRSPGSCQTGTASAIRCGAWWQSSIVRSCYVKAVAR